jgi:hypothetical protein
MLAGDGCVWYPRPSPTNQVSCAHGEARMNTNAVATLPMKPNARLRPRAPGRRSQIGRAGRTLFPALTVMIPNQLEAVT